ncbi:MAG: class I SAM-dependent methyltransferase [Bacteroidetes bacterium]|nr:class I SAM-dependent methyltransferase [Bacteroidota bacterium]
MIKRIINGLRKRGILNALRAFYSKYWFEIRYGLKMNPSMKRDFFGKGKTMQQGHTWYEPISHYTFDRMMKSLDWNFRESTFMDFGCGKGAALLLASRYGFKKCMGVEYNQSLADDCMSIIGKFIKRTKREFTHEIICCDATTYVIPPDVNVFYFFNPFDSALMDIVMQNIDLSLAVAKRPILVLYFNALHKEVIEKYGYKKIYEEPVDKINIWYQGGNYAYTK